MVNSFDVTTTYQVTHRFGLSLTFPFQRADYSTIQGDGMRHTGSAGGLGDMRLLATVWLLDPARHILILAWESSRLQGTGCD